MSRRRVAAKRDILPDPKYEDEVIAKFVNMVTGTRITQPYETNSPVSTISQGVLYFEQPSLTSS